MLFTSMAHGAWRKSPNASLRSLPPRFNTAGILDMGQVIPEIGDEQHYVDSRVLRLRVFQQLIGLGIMVAFGDFSSNDGGAESVIGLFLMAGCADCFTFALAGPTPFCPTGVIGTLVILLMERHGIIEREADWVLASDLRVYNIIWGVFCVVNMPSYFMNTAVFQIPVLCLAVVSAASRLFFQCHPFDLLFRVVRRN